MQTPQEVLGRVILGALVVVFILVALYVFGGKLMALLQSPAELRAARGNNAALAKGAGASNKGVEALKAEGVRRQAESAEAVKGAGKPQFARAREIAVAPCTWGKNDYECANGRIDRELGLK